MLEYLSPCSPKLQVILLLQSSDRVSHDICESIESLRRETGQATPLVLALRRWHKLSPEREFRCFVKDSKLAGLFATQSVPSCLTVHHILFVHYAVSDTRKSIHQSPCLIGLDNRILNVYQMDDTENEQE